jgi:hypothetical protein
MLGVFLNDAEDTSRRFAVVNGDPLTTMGFVQPLTKASSMSPSVQLTGGHGFTFERGGESNPIPTFVISC